MIRPVVGVSRPASNPNSVLFPLPEAPMITTNCPAGTSKSTPRRISTRWEPVSIVLVSPCAWRMNILFYYDGCRMRSLFFLALVMALGGCSRPQERVEERKPTPGPPPVSVDNRRVLVVFGDSISAGFGLPEGQSFPDDLQKKLDSWHVVNLG